MDALHSLLHEHLPIVLPLTDSFVDRLPYLLSFSDGDREYTNESVGDLSRPTVSRIGSKLVMGWTVCYLATPRLKKRGGPTIEQVPLVLSSSVQDPRQLISHCLQLGA